MSAVDGLAHYGARVARTAQAAQAASASLREVGATATSPRGEVSVTVNAAGLLEHVAMTPVARRLEVDVLATLVLTTAREAQRLANARMSEVMAGYLGSDSPALAQITRYLPEGAGR